MCGRFSLTEIKGFKKRFGVNKIRFKFQLLYNIAPGAKTPIIFRDRQAELMEWGIEVQWKKGEAPKRLINARQETISTKRTFKQLFISQRCLVPATGFYEWKKIGKIRQPYYFHTSWPIFSFAGLFSNLSGKNQYCIITIDAYGPAAKIHSRLPVIFSPQEEKIWLTKSLPSSLKKIMRKSTQLYFYPVSDLINNPQINNPDLITELKIN